MPESETSVQDMAEILSTWGSTGAGFADDLFPLIYDDLRRQARAFLRRERPGHTLQATDLINETYLKLREQRNLSWESRAHFVALCATMMRRILVDHARKRNREKRGGRNEHVQVDGLTIADGRRTVDTLSLNDALDRLAENDKQQARIVELRFFGGLSIDDTAAVLSVSPSTVKRDWRAAKAWLFHELESRGIE